jgi:dsDNA-specific endonuclease/ATPase MutS2
MQSAAFRALEFDRIRVVLATRALTPLGRSRLLALEPSTEADEVRARLDLTLEGVEFERQGGSLDIHAPEI